MNKEYFKILKEISSLEKARDQFLYENSEETARIDKLIQKEDEARSEKEDLQRLLEDLKAQSTENENALSQTSSKLAKIKADIAGTFDSKNVDKMEHQSESLSEKIDQLEDLGLELLEKSEEIEKEIKEKETFLSGIAETIEEIKKDVMLASGANTKQIETLDNRIDNNLKQLPENFVRAYEQVKSRKLSVAAFTSIASGKCQVCKMSVDKTKERQVEEELALKTCSSCGRIFIPKEALF